jgi:hypothetical protein
MGKRPRTVGLFALAGVVLPGVTWLLLTAAITYAPRPIEDAVFWLFAASYPFWVLLWGVMADPTNDLFFLGLVCGSLLLNSALYAVIGLLYALIRERFVGQSQARSIRGAG